MSAVGEVRGAPGAGEARDRAEACQACEACLRRSWLLVRLAPFLERARAHVLDLLTLRDEELIAALGGRSAGVLRRELEVMDPESERRRIERGGVITVCLHHRRYPHALRDLAAPPAILHIAGDWTALERLLDASPVAIVGSRRAGPYGRDAARSLARDLSGAGLAVVSGMALGIDAAAHEGALAGEAGTIAVLAAGPERPYPASHRSLHDRIRREGSVVSELGPGTPAWRWAFPARNRIIAALSRMTIVVEAGERSGALITAHVAARLGREVGAVPGRVGDAEARGPNELLAGGARVIRGAQDVLDAVFGVGVREPAQAPARAPLTAREALLLERLGSGASAEEAAALAGLSPEQGLAHLAALELAGHLRRGPGGGFAVSA